MMNYAFTAGAICKVFFRIGQEIIKTNWADILSSNFPVFPNFKRVGNWSVCIEVNLNTIKSIFKAGEIMHNVSGSDGVFQAQNL